MSETVQRYLMAKDGLAIEHTSRWELRETRKYDERFRYARIVPIVQLRPQDVPVGEVYEIRPLRSQACPSQ